MIIKAFLQKKKNNEKKKEEITGWVWISNFWSMDCYLKTLLFSLSLSGSRGRAHFFSAAFESECLEKFSHITTFARLFFSHLRKSRTTTSFIILEKKLSGFFPFLFKLSFFSPKNAWNVFWQMTTLIMKNIFLLWYLCNGKIRFEN